MTATTKTKRTRIETIRMPKEIEAPFMGTFGFVADGMTMKLAKARKAWLANECERINAMPNREAKVVGKGSYSEITVYEVTEVAAKTQRRATCQVCERDVAVDAYDFIAAHGYQRPGWGWQTASCAGANRKAFEVGHDALDAVIASGPRMIETAVMQVEKAKAHTGPLIRYKKEVQPGTWMWDDAYKSSVHAAEQNVKNLKHYLKSVVERRAAWKMNAEAIYTVAK